ncbi:TetR family transcriptional regulator [Rhodococcus qingshengii]
MLATPPGPRATEMDCDHERSYRPPTNTATRTLQPRAERTRAKLLTAAATKFDSVGYPLASMTDICTDAETTKGGMYFHFASKEAIAQQLITDWSDEMHRAFSDVAATDEPATEQLATAFLSLAHHIENPNLRAGMELSLEPSIDGAQHAYWQWVDKTSDIVDRAIATGEIRDTDTAHRLAWNLCAGFTGAVQASAVLREDIRLTTRIADAITAHLTPASQHKIPATP